MPEAETTAWVAAVVGDGGSVSASRQLLVDNLIVSLKAHGIFTKLDRLWLLKAENTQSALRDIVAAAAATVTISPTFTVDAGYQGNGTTQFIDTNFNPTTAPSPKFVQNSATLFAWSNYSSQSTGSIFGLSNSGGSSNTNLFTRYTDDNFYAAVNDGTFNSFASLDAKGFWAANRSAAGATQYYKNGASIGSGTNASGTPDNVSFRAFVLQNGTPTYWGGIGLAVGLGQSLTAGEHTNLYADLNIYMTGGGYAAFSIPQLDGRTVGKMIGY